MQVEPIIRAWKYARQGMRPHMIAEAVGIPQGTAERVRREALVRPPRTGPRPSAIAMMGAHRDRAWVSVYAMLYTRYAPTWREGVDYEAVSKAYRSYKRLVRHQWRDVMVEINDAVAIAEAMASGSVELRWCRAHKWSYLATLETRRPATVCPICTLNRAVEKES